MERSQFNMLVTALQNRNEQSSSKKTENGRLVRRSSASILICLSAFSLFAAQDSLHVRELTDARPADAKSAVSELLFMDGDIAFRRGRDLMARIVLSQGADTPRYSHVGVVVTHGKDAFVVHSLPGDQNSAGGVIVEPVGQFASPRNASEFALYRVIGLSDERRTAVREYALAQVGKPFDEQFLFSESQKLYCSELVIKAFQSVESEVIAQLPFVRVMMLSEPVVPPDYLRRSPMLTLVGEAHVDSRE